MKLRSLPKAILLLGMCAFLGLTANAQYSGGKVEKFALVIGIKGYPNFPTPERLNYTDSDAQAFRDFLLTPAGGNFAADNVKLLRNGQATNAGILEHIGWLGRVTKAYDNAVVYVYFAGHGVEDIQGRAYLMPFEAHKDDPFSTGGIRANRFLQDLKESVNAKHLVLFIDACYAGAVVTAAGTTKGNRNVSAEFMETWASNIKSLQGGTMGFFSATSNQLSFEDHELKRGLFTHFLLMGLKGKADRDRDGRVDAGELNRYVGDEVEKASVNKFRRKQTPAISPTFEPDLLLAITPSINDLNPQLRFVKFFEHASSQLPERTLRKYSESFPKPNTRYVNWELSLGVPAPGTLVNFSIDAVWHWPSGKTTKETRKTFVQDNWITTYHTGDGYGYNDPGKWRPGSYQVDFFLDGKIIASKFFTISDLPSVPTFESQNPTVTFIKFYESEKGDILPEAQRKYATKFAAESARYISWVINIPMTRAPVDFDFKIETIWYAPDGSVFGDPSLSLRVSKEWEGIKASSYGFGFPNPGNWKLGKYRVDFFVNGKKIASETFEIKSAFSLLFGLSPR